MTSINNSDVTIDLDAQLGHAHTELTTSLTEGRAGSHNPDTTGTPDIPTACYEPV